MTRLATNAVDPQRNRRSRWLNVLLVVVCPIFAVAAVMLAIDERWGWAALAAFDALVPLPGALLRLSSYGGKQVGQPVSSTSVTLEITGPAEAMVSRLQRAFLDLRALGVAGCAISTSDDRHVIEGGTGAWGVDGNEGYFVRATAVRAGDHWTVTIESMNYVPTFLQSLHNPRNVGRIMRALLA